MKISRTMSISKILIDSFAIIQNIKVKKYFCRYCLRCFSIERILVEYRDNFLIINGKQSLKLKRGSIKFKNHFKQIAVSFKICANFECSLNKIHSDNNNASCTEKCQDHKPCSFA